METGEIYIVYVSWGAAGKVRPVLLLNSEFGKALVFSITTQYAGKSDAMRKKYFEIKDWAASGLDKPSYVDTNQLIALPETVLSGKRPAGKLTDADKQDLFIFLTWLF